MRSPANHVFDLAPKGASHGRWSPDLDGCLQWAPAGLGSAWRSLASSPTNWALEGTTFWIRDLWFVRSSFSHLGRVPPTSLVLISISCPQFYARDSFQLCGRFVLFSQQDLSSQSAQSNHWHFRCHQGLFRYSVGPQVQHLGATWQLHIPTSGSEHRNRIPSKRMLTEISSA